MPSNVIKVGGPSAHRQLDRAARVRSGAIRPFGGPARRAAHRIDRLPPPTCLGLISCSEDRHHSPTPNRPLNSARADPPVLTVI
jgi:hypothetical protein